MLTIIRLDRFFSEESRDHGLSRREEGKEEIERERERDAGYLKMEEEYDSGKCFDALRLC